jgi:hypothetical protein
VVTFCLFIIFQFLNWASYAPTNQRNEGLHIASFTAEFLMLSSLFVSFVTIARVAKSLPLTWWHDGPEEESNLGAKGPAALPPLPEGGRGAEVKEEKEGDP